MNQNKKASIGPHNSPTGLSTDKLLLFQAKTKKKEAKNPNCKGSCKVPEHERFILGENTCLL